MENVVAWRKVAFVAAAVISAPLWLGLLTFLALLILSRLPMLICERRRAVRFLPLAALVYYGVILPVIAMALPLRLAWWEVLLGACWVALCGGWLLPDPVTFLLMPRKRRAIQKAIEYLEAQDGPGVLYGSVHVIGSEMGRTVVGLPVQSEVMPPERRYLAVADDAGTIEELDFEYVSSRHGVGAWR